jgi:LysR family transcriptional regulator, glycine cleavage system transcriptional activator
MSLDHTGEIKRLPSLRALYIFEAAARHLNLVRAAEEVGLTQGALSRHIQTLEKHLGVPVFVRTSRGLKFTEAGDVLWNHCQRAFHELRIGLGAVSISREPRTLHVAVARSYGTRVISHQISGFLTRYPWIDLVLDGHRYLANLERGEADLAIRVGDGKWPDCKSEKIEDDPIFPVAAPSLIAQFATRDIRELAEVATLLHFSERSYWEIWSREAGIDLPKRRRNMVFSETAMVLEAAEAGQGIAVSHRSIMREAIQSGRLAPVSDMHVDSGIGYFFCATPAARRKQTVKLFRSWIFETARNRH